MPNRDPSINAISTEKARESWKVSPSQTSVRGRLRIPTALSDIWETQDTGDRGLAWAVGCILTNPAASYVVGDDSVTVILGRHSATGSTQYKAVMSLVQSCGYKLPQSNELEDRLNELGLLE